MVITTEGPKVEDAEIRAAIRRALYNSTLVSPRGKILT